MKIRADFVTNSSSSSFVFGEPKTISGETLDNLLNKIETKAKQIVDILEYITEQLNIRDTSCLKLIEQIRLELKIWDKLFDENTDCTEEELSKQWDKGYKLKKSIKNNNRYNSIMVDTYKRFQDTIKDYWDDYQLFYDNISETLFYQDNIDKLYNIKEFLRPLITDFKQSNPEEYNFDAIELLQWYDFETEAKQDKNSEAYKVYLLSASLWEIIEDTVDFEVTTSEQISIFEDKLSKKQEQLRESLIDYNKVIFDTLGEFGIYGLWEGDIPYIIVLILSKEATLSCNHMG